MLDDAELFSQLCEKQAALVEPDISEALKTSCTSGELRLAHKSIIANLCEILAKVISSSSTIKLIDLSDCMLLPKGLSCILKALSDGSSVTSLHLKGNNISGSLVEQLGELLMRNSTIKVLNLEWNNLGSQADSFAKFCEGLARNHNIEKVNLKYNQISGSCVDSLGIVLRNNRSLKELDLAWNTLGMIGGEKIFESIRQNNVLTSLNLKGNGITPEIYSAIKDQITENQKRRILFQSPIIAKGQFYPVSLTSEEDDRVPQMRYKAQKKKKKRDRSRTPLEELRNSPLGNSGNEENAIEAERKTSSQSNRKGLGFADKIEALNQILQERATIIENLKAELDARDSELATSKAENGELNSEIQHFKEENERILEQKMKEIEHLKKTHARLEREWEESRKELEEAFQNNLKTKQELSTENQNLQKELKKVTFEFQSLKEKLTSTGQSYEDTISDYKVEVHRLKREMQERDNKSKIETNALKESLKESSMALEKCQEQLQKLRDQFRESLEVQAKLKIRTEEAERFAARAIKIEETLERFKEEKEKLEDKLQKNRENVACMQKQIIRLQEEAIEPQKRYDALKLDLQIEREKSVGLNAELQNERVRMREINDQVQKLLAQINGLYAQISETQNNHAEVVRRKDGEIERLKNVVSQKIRELDEFRTDQTQRAHQFQAAVNKYLASFGPNLAIT